MTGRVPPTRRLDSAPEGRRVGRTTKQLHLAEGGYTVVLPSGAHRTIRVEAAPPGFRAADLIVTLLCGPDNHNDYRPFAHVTPAGTVRVWERFRNDGLLAQVVEVLTSDPFGAARSYGLRSGQCSRCQRLLTHPDSIRRGIGPTCAQRLVTVASDGPQDSA